MSVKFRYIDYGVKFIDVYSRKEKKEEEKKLYIFSDNRMKDIFSRKFSEKIFEKSATLVTFEEFKDRIFYTDKVILKEAKRILAFFKCIPQNIKDELGITNYYDVIDIANNFFSYYRELLLNEVEELEEYPHWQKKYLGYFSQIKRYFDELCEKYNYIPSDWIETKENYSGVWLEKYNKIIFVDMVEFSKIFVDIIEELGRQKEIEIAIQIKEGDYDEKEFKLKKATIPELIKDIEVYLFKDEIEEALSLIQLKKTEKCEIYSPAPEKNRFSKILPSYFAPSQNFTMNDTKLYKFLNIQMDVLSGEEEKLGRVYHISKFLSAFEEKIFKDYYNLSEKEFINLNKIAIEGYKYISRKILKDEWIEKNIEADFIEKLNEIIFDIESIGNILGADDLYIYFKEHIKLEYFVEDNLDNVDIFDEFFEIFGIIKSNEVMKIHSNLNEYFGDRIGMSLYRLLIQYMKDLAIKSNIKYEQDIAVVKGMDFVRYSEEQKDVNYFLDITDEFIPKNLGDTLILTEKQRKELGITTKEEKREIERYRFFQAIFSGKKCVIFTKKDEEKGVEISPFLEEIVLKYSILPQKAPVENREVLNVLKKALMGKEIGYVESCDERYPKAIEDYPEKKLQLGAYDYDKLMKCPLNFYFSNIKGLSYNLKYEDKDISNRVLGIIVHEVLEEYVDSIWKSVLENGIKEIGYDEIFERMKRAFKRERAKIPVHMDNYCYDIMIPLISRNIVKFFESLKNSYEGVTIKRFQSEKSSYEKTPFYSGEIDVYLRGRTDLVIESVVGNEIIDYKTGNKKEGQLDYYTIILYGESGQAKKLVFNAWNGKIEREDKVILTREELEENIKKFVDSREYERTEKKALCTVCEYYNICRRGRE